jgi:nucleotide-binding universal stress UspA family protein
VGTIVCAVDDSPEANEALRVAARLSGDAGLRLVVVHVEDAVDSGSEFRRKAEEHGRRLLDRLLATQGLNGGVDRRVEIGERALELARVAAEEAASVILVGSRRRHWWRGCHTSKLTSDLAATAACPVAVVPPARRR